MHETPAETACPSPALLQARGVSRRFGPVHALSSVDFTLRASEIHALMGENGAGKSTLIKCLTGVHSLDAGDLRLQGRPIAPASPRDAEAVGIATVFQEVNLIPHLSIADNICLGREPTQFGRIRWRAVRQRARAALQRLGLAIDVRRELNSCSIAVQQLVAIARALDIDAKVLILDEPTSSLDRSEVANLFSVMRRLRDQGLGIIFVTHFLDQVYAVADRITVLRDGRFVAEHAAADLPRQKLVGLMVGRELDLAAAAGPAGPATESATVPLLEARSLARRGCVEHADITISPGQTVSLAGLLGSGRTESARLLFGADRFDRGQLLIDARPVRFRAPRHAIRRRIALTPENRKDHGIIPSLSVRENIELALRARGRARLSRAQARQLAERFIRALNIKTPGPDTPVSSLSGGNQQKVLLARWLATEPRLLILDEPTRGIDVAAKAEIIREIDHLRREGMAILFISSELEEVVRVSQRVVVLRDRRTVAQLSGAQITEQAVLGAIAGSA
ncbi:MAG: sugar ABC transporter ATP-binding protein [Leptolyngbya sp. PLA3]|nr:MAG: sugar ABC transporter ATP-binding protein [Cyanobacteria bacterium CYA]MCE7969371.1 sugar ABC transporter ATP-binding protein [Leptolyngbya sp. PL-A3]